MMAKIQYIINTKTGEEIIFDDILKANALHLKEYRIEWDKNLLFKKPLYVCGMCKYPLSLRSCPKCNKKLILVHPKNSPECIWKSGKEKSQEEVLRMFENIRESKEHKELKAFIHTHLDIDGNFIDIKPEKRFKANFTKDYRVPDVQATQISYKKNLEIKKHIVFEIQLSSNTLGVILEREKHYFDNCANLIWIFSKFSNDLSRTRMTEDDILFTSKKNVFILDDEAKLKSIKYNSLYLKNIHLIPFIDDNLELNARWSDTIMININDITFDELTGKSYVYNFDEYRTRSLYELKLKNLKYKSFYNFVKDNIYRVLSEGIHFNNIPNQDNFDEFKNEHLMTSIYKSKKIISYIFEIIHIGHDKSKDKIFTDTHDYILDKDNRIMQILGVILNPKQNYSGIIIRAIDYYAKSDKLISLYENKFGKREKFIANIHRERKYIIDDLEPYYEVSLKYLFPELFYISNINKAKN